MKEVLAIIRMNKVTQTKKALTEAGYAGMTAMKVMGRGKMLKDIDSIQELADHEDLRDTLLESLLKGGRLIPKRMIMLAVPDAEVEKAVEIIIKANKEGHVGDGKIFVSPFYDAVRVRTGEKGEAAV